METAHWLDWEAAAPKNPGAQALPDGRIYLGSETCENALPPAAIAAEIIAHLLHAGRPVSLVTPVVTEKGLASVSALLKKLARSGARVEVVCSDWGVFETALSFPNCTPVIGRLLSRQCSDPRFAFIDDAPYQTRFEKEIVHLDGTVAQLKYRPPTAGLLRAIRTPAILHPDLLAYLAELGAARLEISNLLQGVELALPAGWSVTVHVPEVIVAVRRCALAAGKTCAMPCQADAARIDTPGFPVPLWVTRSQVVYHNDDLSQIPAGGPVDRVVYRQPHPAK